MRKRQYMTMIDPIQERFGNKVGMLNILPAFMGDIFWIASILNSLGRYKYYSKIINIFYWWFSFYITNYILRL